MIRRIARESAVQFLFQLDFNPDDVDSALAYFWKQKPVKSGVRKFAETLIHGVLNNRPEIDLIIQKYAEHWDLKRIGGVDRNIIRMALYEMIYCPDIPRIVSINEAVDIARRFSSDESGRFVNGILDSVKTHLEKKNSPAISE